MCEAQRYSIRRVTRSGEAPTQWCADFRVIRLPSPKDGIDMTVTIVPWERAHLTLADRCDTCGAQAFIRAIFVSGELTFCGHHGRLMSTQLRQQAILVEDGTDLINTKPSRSD